MSDGTDMGDETQGRSTGRILRLVVLAVILLVVGAAFGAGVYHELRKSQASTASVAQASAGYGLAAPASAVIAGHDLYVANQGGNSISVVNASTGAHVATWSEPSLGLDQPSAVASDGTDLLVANGAGDSVTEVAIGGTAPGAVRIVAGPQYRFSDPIALTTDDGTAFVLSANGTVTALSTSTGGLVGVASGPAYGFSGPSSVAVYGDNLFVTNSGGDSVSVVDVRTLSPIRVIDDSSYGFRSPTGAVVYGGDLWVTNATSDSVTELLASNGDLVRVIVDHTNLPTPGPITAGAGYVFTLSPPGVSPMVSQIVPASGKVAWMMCNTNGPYLFANPQAVAVAGSNLWVVNKDSNSLTEMDSDSGALIRTIS